MATQSESFARQVLEGFGFMVQRIQESENKTPDFVVSDDHHRYLVEVKEKLPNPSRLKERDAALSSSGIHEEHDPVGPLSRLSSIVHGGSKQLAAGGEETAEFRLIWLQATGYRRNVQLDQFLYTLYGIRDLTWLADMSTRHCFFYTFSAFHRDCEVLDGAVISTGEKYALCLNPLSSRFAELRESPLAERFAPGLVDPVRLESEGRAYIADTDLPRRELGQVLRYVQRKYGLENMLTEQVVVESSAEMLVPRELDAEEE